MFATSTVSLSSSGQSLFSSAWARSVARRARQSGQWAAAEVKEVMVPRWAAGGIGVGW